MPKTRRSVVRNEAYRKSAVGIRGMIQRAEKSGIQQLFYQLTQGKENIFEQSK